MYVTYAAGSLAQTYKLRLCELHFRDLMNVVNKQMAVVDTDSQMSTACEQCDQDRSATVFAKVFEGGADPVQYAVDLCARHSEALLALLKIGNGRALADR